MPIPRLAPPPRTGIEAFDRWATAMYQRLMALQPSEDSAGVLTQAQATDLTDGTSSDLHYHASDRARSNHTGTQLSSTISDFAAAVSAISASSDHSTLNNLSWLISGHTGTLNTIPAFSATGSAIELTKTGTGTVVAMQADPDFTGEVNAEDVVASGDVQVDGLLLAHGNVNLGNQSTDTLSIAPNAVTWQNAVTHSNDHTFSGSVTVQANTTIGNANTDTLTIAPDAVTWSNNPTHSGTHTYSVEIRVPLIRQAANTGTLDLRGGNSAGGNLLLYGSTHANAGQFVLRASNGTFSSLLTGTHLGALDWTGDFSLSGGAFSCGDLTTTGNTILGNASTDTLNVGSGGIIKDGSNLTGFGVSPTHRLTVQSTAATDPAAALMGSGSTNHRMYLGYNSTSGYGSIRAVNEGTGAVPLRLQESGGSVGVGVDPTHRLTVQSDGATNPAMTLMGSGSTNHRIYFTYNSTSGYGSIRAANEGTGNVTLALQESGGRVLVGTATDDGSTVLQIAGGVLATGNLVVQGNTTVGNASGDTLTVHPNAVTWSNAPTHSNNHTFSGTITASNVLSGTYTPTLTNTTNIASSTAQICQYLRVGNMVHVTGTATVDPTSASAQTLLKVTLPVASNMANARELAGTCCHDQGNSSVGWVTGDAATDVANCHFFAASGNSGALHFTFSYQVI